MSEIKAAITSLIKQHGSLRKAADFIGMDAAYMCRLKSGEKDNPSEAVLEQLGLVKNVTYARRIHRVRK